MVGLGTVKKKVRGKDSQGTQGNFGNDGYVDVSVVMVSRVYTYIETSETAYFTMCSQLFVQLSFSKTV